MCNIHVTSYMPKKLIMIIWVNAQNYYVMWILLLFWYYKVAINLKQLCIQTESCALIVNK